jgi:hypothetical protein
MNNIISQEGKDYLDKVCKKYRIRNYKINGDGSINANGDIDLDYLGLKSLPLKFNKVNGNFSCCGNNLTNLFGSPQEVGGYFYCSSNKLTSLEGSPNMVGKQFDCSDNKLKSPEHCPKKIGGTFNCGDNKLTTLKGSPVEVGGHFYCNDNKLKSLAYLDTKYGGNFYYGGNNLPGAYDEVYNLSHDEQMIFIKYQSYFEVWTPEINEENMKDLIAEIKDGLK